MKEENTKTRDGRWVCRHEVDPLRGAIRRALLDGGRVEIGRGSVSVHGQQDRLIYRSGDQGWAAILLLRELGFIEIQEDTGLGQIFTGLRAVSRGT